MQRIVQLFENVNFKDFCLLLSNFRRASQRRTILGVYPQATACSFGPFPGPYHCDMTVIGVVGPADRRPNRLALSARSDRSAPEDRFRFVFNVYDVDGDGFISRSDMLTIMRNRAGSQLTCACWIVSRLRPASARQATAERCVRCVWVCVEHACSAGRDAPSVTDARGMNFAAGMSNWLSWPTEQWGICLCLASPERSEEYHL